MAKSIKLKNDTYWDVESVDNRYSEEEKRIGTWLGKPLYRKTITFTETITNGTLLTKSHNISNINFIKIKEFILTSTSGLTYTFPVVGYNGNLTDKGYAYVDRTNLYVYSNGGWATSWKKIAVLEYTKTTD